MRKVGKITTFLLVLGTCGAVVLGIQSIPDIKRYLRIRKM